MSLSKVRYMKEKIYIREKYLTKIRPFYHSDIVKVITGIRRCGKSFLMKSIINELVKTATTPDRIILFTFRQKRIQEYQNSSTT